MSVAEYVTVAELTGLLGVGADPARVQLAVDAANLLIDSHARILDPGDPTLPTSPAPVTPVTHQAGMELSHLLYVRHAAVGGIFNAEELYARLPADTLRGVRTLLDAATEVWGVG